MSGAPDDVTRWLRLAPAFDVERLRADLDTALALHWQAHYNDQAHQGSWTSIALRSNSGRPDDIHAGDGPGFIDTPLLLRCPYLRQVIDSFACDKQSVRLMALDAGARIKPHRDPGGAFEDGLARLHVPIATDPAVLFTLDGQDVHFGAGATWYMNASCLHAVRNDSGHVRVHLVLDCVPNPWLRTLFEDAGWRAPPAPKYGDPAINDANVDDVISQLHALGTPAAEAMATRLTYLALKS